MQRFLFYFLFIFSFQIIANAQVGERSNRSFKTKYGGFISTWDGRIIVFPSHIQNGQYKWQAYAFRYENIKTNSKGEPNLLDESVYSPLVTLDSDGAFDAPENKLNAQERMHIALIADSDFKQNPYPSDENGNPVLDINSPYRTYRLFIVATVQRLKSYIPNKTIPAMLTQTTGQIIIKNSGKHDAEIISAKILEEGKPVRSSPTGEPFFGFEPTLSNDGRLLLWGGHPINGGIHYIMYSFNKNPKDSNGWSKPKHLTQLYWEHGPGSGNEILIDGVKFSSKYPIAKKPLKDAYGNYLVPENGFPGAYPWLTLDNSELFCATVATFFAARRAGYTVIGALTDYTARHIDGYINIARGNVTKRGDLWISTPEGKLLEEKYQKLTDEYGVPYGHDSFQRILISVLGLFPSMWSPYLENNIYQKTAIPFSRKKYTFGLIMSHSNRYVEVSFPEAADKNYILNLPMNEAISYNQEYLAKMNKHRDVINWEDNRLMATYDPHHTPDISGHHQTAKLVGAQFPFEYFEADKVWRESKEVVDKIAGVEGNSIFFKPRSYLSILLKPESLKQLHDTKELNISFFIRTYEDLKNELLLNWNQFLRLTMDGTTLNIQSYKNEKWETSLKVATIITPQTWQHVSINLTTDEISVYWNSILIAHKKHNFVMPSFNEITVGPTLSQTRTTKALYSVDEFSISKILRTADEIREFALILKPTVEKSNSSDSPELILLGKKLFHDPILSRDKTVSCATCHIPKNHFVDNLRVARGIENRSGTRNTPGLFNVAHLETLMWDGKAKTLEEQALMPIQNPVEMGLTLPEALSRIETKYGKDFLEIFNEKPSERTLGRAIAAFQKTITHPKTALDLNKLNTLEMQGRGLFFGKARCVSCHSGNLFTDQNFHNLGFKYEPLKSEDIGREMITKRQTDRLKFRTPSLRGLKLTAPYFHDGRFESLQEVIMFYNRGGDTAEGRAYEIQPLGLTAEEMHALQVFLETL